MVALAMLHDTGLGTGAIFSEYDGNSSTARRSSTAALDARLLSSPDTRNTIRSMAQMGSKIEETERRREDVDNGERERERERERD